MPRSAVGNMSDYRFRGRKFNPGPVLSHTFVEIDNEIISTAILLSPADSRRVVVSYKRKYVQEVLVNRLVKLGQEKSVVRGTDRPDMTIAVDWEEKNQTENKHLCCQYATAAYMYDKKMSQLENICVILLYLFSFYWALTQENMSSQLAFR